MIKFIIFDFEVFKYDVLLGAYIVNEQKYFQSWDKEEIKKFYYENDEAVWVGHNNSHYDNYILQAILFDLDIYAVSKQIIKENKKPRLNIKLHYYDLMTWHFGSLKVIEAQMGKNISESEVDFDIQRPLTDEEKLETESYNRDDLNQTYLDTKLCKDEIQLRFDIMKEFGLGYSVLRLTENQIAERVLKPVRIHGIENMFIKPVLHPQLQLKNERVKQYYLNKEWETIPKIKVNICGLEHVVAKGGIHAAEEKSHYDWALYLDVSGYYNLVMINYDLLPRTLDEDGKKLYVHLYQTQLGLKTTNPRKRAPYKKICLAVFGAELNEYCNFYDPQKGRLVTITGEIFIVDLLEKLEGKIILIQSNTDGIMVKPLPGHTEEEILDIVKEWCDRTGFVIEPKKIYDIHQRDVNNYMYRDAKGRIHTKGEAVKYYECWENPFVEDSYNTKEPYIIHYAIVDYYMNNINPEETIEKYKHEPRMFQYICKPLSFDYLTFEADNVIRLQNVNRCFASKTPGMIYKNKPGKHDKYSNLPDRVFVFNKDLSELNTNLIDYDYYIKRSWERINEFRKDYEQLSLF